MKQIDTLRRAALSAGHFANSRDLSGFAMDADYSLGQTGQFAGVRSSKTGDPRRAIVITCRPAFPELSSSEIQATLERVWKMDLDYGGQPSGFETEVRAGSLVFEFVTTSVDKGLVVSGAIEVTGLGAAKE